MNEKRKLAAWFVACLPAMLLHGALGTQTQPPPTPAHSEASHSTEEFELPVDEELVAEIDAQIARLGSPAYKERDEATKALIEIGARALPQLRTAYARAEELEVRLRLEEIVHAAYFDYHVFNRYGFLGVGMRPYVPSAVRNVVLPEGTAGLIATQIIEDTGAERAGMKKNDVIIGLDGEPLEGSGQQILDSFSAAIRARRPGAVMALKVVRGSKRLDIKATLGRCPERLARRGTVRGTSDQFRRAESSFPTWWTDQFRRPAAQKNPQGNR